MHLALSGNVRLVEAVVLCTGRGGLHLGAVGRFRLPCGSRRRFCHRSTCLATLGQPLQANKGQVRETSMVRRHKTVRCQTTNSCRLPIDVFAHPVFGQQLQRFPLVSIQPKFLGKGGRAVART